MQMVMVSNKEFIMCALIGIVIFCVVGLILTLDDKIVITTTTTYKD